MTFDVKNNTKVIALPTANNKLTQSSLNDFRMLIPEISFKRAKKLLEDAKVSYIEDKPISEIQLLSILDSIIREKAKEVKKSTGNLANLDLMIYDNICLMELPLLADSYMSNFYYNYNTFPNNELRKNIFNKVTLKVISIGQESHAREMAIKYAHFWGAKANYALTLEIKALSSPDSICFELLNEASKLFKDATEIVHKQYSQSERNANSQLSITRFGEGDVQFIRGIKDPNNAEIHWDNAYHHYSFARSNGFGCEELFRNFCSINTIKRLYPDAYECLFQAIILNPLHIENYINGYWALKNSGFFDEATQFLALAGYIDYNNRNFITAKKDYNETTELKLNIKYSKISPKDNPLYLETRNQYIRDNASKCLDTIILLKQSPINAAKNNQLKLFSTLINKTNMNLANSINFNSSESFYSAQKNLYKAGLHYPSANLNTSFIAVFSCAGAYEQASEILNRYLYSIGEIFNISFSNPNINKAFAKMKMVIKHPKLYLKHAKRALEQHPDEWTAHSNMGNACILVAEQLKDEARLKYLDLAYQHFEIAETLLNKMISKVAKGIIPEHFKDIFQFTHGPRFKMGFVRLFQFVETINLEKPNQSYYKEAKQKILEAKNLGYESAQLYFALGLIERFNENSEKTFEYLERSHSFDNNYIRPIVGLANLNMDIGDLEIANILIEDALNINPKDPGVIVTLKRYTELLEEFDYQLNNDEVQSNTYV